MWTYNPNQELPPEAKQTSIILICVCVLIVPVVTRLWCYFFTVSYFAAELNDFGRWGCPGEFDKHQNGKLDQHALLDVYCCSEMHPAKDTFHTPLFCISGKGYSFHSFLFICLENCRGLKNVLIRMQFQFTDSTFLLHSLARFFFTLVDKPSTLMQSGCISRFVILVLLSLMIAECWETSALGTSVFCRQTGQNISL